MPRHSGVEVSQIQTLICWHVRLDVPEAQKLVALSGRRLVSYWNWVVQCKNYENCEEQIQLLRPTLLGTIDDPKWYPPDDLQMLFLCPECGSVCAYNAADFRRAVFQTPAPYLPSNSALAYVEFECGEGNCEILARICMHSETTWRANRDDILSRMQAGKLRDVSCLSGHALQVGKILFVRSTTYPKPAFRSPDY